MRSSEGDSALLRLSGGAGCPVWVPGQVGSWKGREVLGRTAQQSDGALISQHVIGPPGAWAALTRMEGEQPVACAVGRDRIAGPRGPLPLPSIQTPEATNCCCRMRRERECGWT